jgi:hypothetical protein
LNFCQVGFDPAWKQIGTIALVDDETGLHFAATLKTFHLTPLPLKQNDRTNYYVSLKDDPLVIYL